MTIILHIGVNDSKNAMNGRTFEVCRSRSSCKMELGAISPEARSLGEWE